MIYLPNMQVVFASGASAMSGTLAATALANTGYLQYQGRQIYTVRATLATTHAVVAGSQLYFSCLDNAVLDNVYKNNVMRLVVATPAGTTMDVAAPEGYTAGTPTTGELWAAGYVSPEPYWFIGFKLHLSAADTNAEALTLTTDAARGAAWDTLLYKKESMIGVTDIVNFPTVPIPMEGKDIIKFLWANSGAKTWGIEIYVAPRI